MSVLVFVPMYNCRPQIGRVLAQLDTPAARAQVDGVLCVDNCSTDGTLEAAAEELEALSLPHRTLLRNDENYGLGGSHKVAIEFARAQNYKYLVVLHGDDQGDISDLLTQTECGAHREVDFLMGARFMPESRLVGYSMLRTYANKAFNRLFSAVLGARLYDLGSGLNLFRVNAFADGFHRRFADDLTFNYYLIIAIVDRGALLRFFPLTWREDDQISNAKLGRMGWCILRLLGCRMRRPYEFARQEHRDMPREAYPSTHIGSWDG